MLASPELFADSRLFSRSYRGRPLPDCQSVVLSGDRSVSPELSCLTTHVHLKPQGLSDLREPGHRAQRRGAVGPDSQPHHMDSNIES